MLVKLKHGTCNYKGTRYSAGDELDITELFYNSNSGRFTPVEVEEIRNIEPTPKKRTRKKKSTEGGKDI